LYYFVPNVEILDSIFRSKEFWFKSVSESNDPDEKYFTNHITPIYQACFSGSCMEEDLWDEYNCGICIQIKPQLTIFAKNNEQLGCHNFIIKSSRDREAIKELGLILGKNENHFDVMEEAFNGYIIHGPFPKNYINEYENIKFDDPFLRSFYKTSSTWKYQNEWRYLVDLVDNYFEMLFPGSYEYKNIEILPLIKIPLNNIFFNHSKILYNPRLLNNSDIINKYNMTNFKQADTTDFLNNEVVPFSEYNDFGSNSNKNPRPKGRGILRFLFQNQSNNDGCMSFVVLHNCL